MTCLISFYGAIFVDMLYLPSIYANTLIASAMFTALICGIQLALGMRSLKLHLTSLYKGQNVTSLFYLLLPISHKYRLKIFRFSNFLKKVNNDVLVLINK